MKKTFLTAALCTLFIVGGSFAAQKTTRYWDACKPSCGWNGNASGSPNGICTSCDVQGNKLSGEGGQSACQGGPAYTCMGQAPWAVDDNLAYGFAAAHLGNSACGKCYELTFTNNGEGGTVGGSIQGKKMIVMASNTGNIQEGAVFDLMIPGGGVGDFDALSKQVSQNGGPSNYSSWGARYGGFRAAYEGGCGNDAACVRKRCDEAFNTPALSHLKEGCHWFVDWFKNANNPMEDHKEVTCPQILIDVYKGTKWRPSGGTIQPTTYKLQVARSPTAGGNVSVNNGANNPTGESSHNAGTSISIKATANSGYEFQNWTAASGSSLPSGVTATNATITFSINSNVNLTANFRQTVTPPTTYTLQVSRSPTAGGSVSVKVGTGTAQNNPQNSQNVNANTSVTVAATAASGYTFVNWTAVSGSSLPTGFSATSASVTFNIGANVNIRANFTQNQTNPDAKYTLTVTRSPSAGGTTTPASSQADIVSGTPVNISASANSGYTFNEWTLVSGTATFANAKNAATTVTLSSNATVRANFQQGSVNPPVVNGDTITVEAEDATVSIAACPQNPPSGQAMCVGTNTTTGVSNIGYISDGNSTTYSVSVAKDGMYTMVFSIASNWDQGESSFKVTVNGTEVGTISGHTNNWDEYTYVTLDSEVSLTAGENTIKLDFKSPINVDNFLIIGEKEETTPVRYNAPRTVKARAAVTLKAVPRGFTAVLPSNHAYTSYRLIDMQGREVRSGKIGNGVTTLNFNNAKRSVLFLKLEGKGSAPVVVRAVTY